jgi:hypothetical protein
MANGPNPLAACLHSVGTARLVHHTQSTTTPAVAHGCPALDRAARAACTLGGAACTLDGGVHARRRGDFTDMGGWPAMHSERWCSTQIERRPRQRCFPVRRRMGWRRGWGRRRAPARRPTWRTEGVRAAAERSAVAHGGTYPRERLCARATAVARDFGPRR